MRDQRGVYKTLGRIDISRDTQWWITHSLLLRTGSILAGSHMSIQRR